MTTQRYSVHVHCERRLGNKLVSIDSFLKEVCAHSPEYACKVAKDEANKKPGWTRVQTTIIDNPVRQMPTEMIDALKPNQKPKS